MFALLTFLSQIIFSVNMLNNIKASHCPVLGCPKTFIGGKPLNDHIRNRHEFKPDQKGTCQICGETFDNIDYFLEHYRRNHERETPKRVLPIHQAGPSTQIVSLCLNGSNF